MTSDNSKKTTRLDEWVLAHGITPSKTRAQRLIKEHGVLVNGKLRTKPGFFVLETDKVELTQEDHHYVSRGAFKLIKALNSFNINPKNKVCLDIGASTGGFTQVLLERGAQKVFAVDVGSKQLHASIATNSKVHSIEQTNILDLKPTTVDEAQLIVIDVSFVSLTKIVPVLHSFLSADGHVVALIKPQFEVGKEAIGKKGIVTNPRAHEFAKDSVKKSLDAHQFKVHGEIIESPVKGGDGNKEFLICFSR